MRERKGRKISSDRLLQPNNTSGHRLHLTRLQGIYYGTVPNVWLSVPIEIINTQNGSSQKLHIWREYSTLAHVSG